MPTYVYRCDSCEHQFEIFQKMSDDPLDTCPNCSAKIRRVIHPVGIVFKGSGWYINDSKSSNSTSSSSTEAPAASAESSDSKPAATKTDTETKSSAKEPAKTAAD